MSAGRRPDPKGAFDARDRSSGSVGISILSFREIPSHSVLESLRTLETGGRRVVAVHRVQGAEVEGEEAPAAFPNGLEYQRVTQRPNFGFARGHNRNAAALRGCDLFWILNDDVLFAPGVLVQLVEFLESHPGTVAVGPEIVPSWVGEDLGQARTRPHDAGVGWFLPWKGVVRQLRGGEPAPDFAAYSFLSGCAPLWRASAFLELGGFHEPFFAYHEDSLLSLTAFRRHGDRALGYCARARVQHYEAQATRAAAVGGDDPTSERSAVFDYFDMRNGLQMARTAAPWPQRLTRRIYFGYRLARKILRPWVRGERSPFRKNRYALRGWLDGLPGPGSGELRLCPRIRRELKVDG